MIYLHRFQTSDFKYSDLDNERFDGITTEMRYLPLADNLVISDVYSTYPVVDTFKNLLSTKKDIIIDCKESGVEDKILSKIGIRSNLYFLNSKLYDIIRLCKTNPELLGHFIVNVSSFEGFSNKLVEWCKPTKFWVDTNLCVSKCAISDIVSTIVNLSACYGLEPEIILTSPDVIGVDSKTDYQIECFKKYFKSLNTNIVSVCTKFPERFLTKE